MTSVESEKCNQLLKACRLPFWCMFCALPTRHQQTESTGQKPDKADPRPGQAADRSMKTRSASLSETLLADQRKNKGFKLNCRGGVFLKGWGYARSWMSSPCVTKNPMSNNKQTHCMNSHLESSSECFWGSEIHFSRCRQGRWETARHRLQGTTAPKPLLLWRQHHPRPPVLPSDLTFQALKNTNISAGTVHSPLPADPHQLILTRLCSQQA